MITKENFFKFYGFDAPNLKEIGKYTTDDMFLIEANTDLLMSYFLDLFIYDQLFEIVLEFGQGFFEVNGYVNDGTLQHLNSPRKEKEKFVAQKTVDNILEKDVNLIFYGGTFIGFTAGEKNEITMMFILPSWQDKGLGKRAFKLFCEQAQKKKYKNVEIQNIREYAHYAWVGLTRELISVDKDDELISNYVGVEVDNDNVNISMKALKYVGIL